MNDILAFGLEKIAELCIDLIKTPIKNASKREELINSINEHTKRELKNNIYYLDRESEIDFGGLCNYLNSKCVDDIKSILTDFKYESRITFFEKAYDAARADNKNKRDVVYKLLKDITSIIENRYIGEVDEKYLYLYKNALLEFEEINGKLNNLQKSADRTEQKVDELNKKLNNLNYNVCSVPHNPTNYALVPGNEFSNSEGNVNALCQTIKASDHRLKAAYAKTTNGAKCYPTIVVNSVLDEIQNRYPSEDELYSFTQKLLNDKGDTFTYDGKSLVESELDSVIARILLDYSKITLASNGSPERTPHYLCEAIYLFEKNEPPQTDLLSECLSLKAESYSRLSGRGNELMTELLTNDTGGVVLPI